MYPLNQQTNYTMLEKMQNMCISPHDLLMSEHKITTRADSLLGQLPPQKKTSCMFIPPAPLEHQKLLVCLCVSSGQKGGN